MGRIFTSPWAPAPLYPKCGLFDYVWSNRNNVSEDKPAVVYAPTGEVLTRRELKRECQKLAHSLRHKLGLQPGDVCCIFSPNSIYFQVLCLAGQCAGLVISPANAGYTASELHHQIKDSGSQAVFSAPALLPVVLEATSHWSKEDQMRRLVMACRKNESDENGYKTLDDYLGSDLLEPHVYNDPRNDLAYLCYSSGTTGLPKGVMTTVYNMTSVLSGLYCFMGEGHDVSLGFLPFSHIYGMTKLVHLPILDGQTLIVVPRWDTEVCLKVIQRYKVTMILLVPPVALALASDPLVDKYDVSSIKYVISGAAPLGSELQERLRNRLDCYVTQAYGMTESSPTSHYAPYDRPRLGSCGPSLPNVQTRIVDPVTMKDMPNIGDEGELWMKGPIMMKGYLNRPEATRETLVEDHWLRTGDIAKADEDGWFYITDRIKELIKYKGFQVPPAELEALLLSHPQVADAGVVGVNDDNQGTELPLAYVVLKNPDEAKHPDLADDIVAWVATRVSSHKRLRGGVRFLDVVPKSASGKILRRVLRERAKKEGPVTQRQAKL
ncbi:MAG: hypothetical protein CYPHOPRED_002562 [Cyphobasidiales sp. Tagirdzhanova-0007]|nr:MAG: hypothetical protein CYPHOPRED_002562 [Cyphobasidiales sp. Tagirdzhanova-0007]